MTARVQRPGGRSPAAADVAERRGAVASALTAPLGARAARICLLAAAASLAACESASDREVEAHGGLLEQYCTQCHNALDREAGLVLENAGLEDPARNAAVWEGVIHKLRIGLMPPPGQPRPAAAGAQSLVAYLERSLDTAAAANPSPGRMPLHRLNRAEYRNAVRDLLGLELDVKSLLPADSSSHGFDNVSDVLKTSPMLLERYLTVAMRVAAMAVGDTSVEARTSHYQPPADLSQNQWIEGLPLGTRGGLVVEHYFPVDAQYELRPELWEAAASTVRGLEGFETPFEFEILLDGVPVHRATIGGREDDALSNRDQGSATAAVNERIVTRIPVEAGAHTLGFTFVMKSFAVKQRLLEPFDNDLPAGNDAYGWPRVLRVLVTGPFDATGPGDTPVRRNIFTCRPSASLAHTECARQILRRLARRAYGRAVTPQEIGVLMAFYEQGSDASRGGARTGDLQGRELRQHEFERGIQLALARMLSGPEFLFRGEVAPPPAAPGEIYRIDDATVAGRLALFLWSSIPDEELLELAAAGRLREPDVLQRQVRRMLADPRAGALVENFAAQWLLLRNVPAKSPDLLTFPNWDDNLRRDMLRETNLLLQSVLLGDGSVLDLIDADYTFLNERLARHYGIDGVFGDAFRRVELGDPKRRGLLGHGSILFETSVATRTSPVFRGKWIMTNIFDSPPLPPPPDIPALAENTAGAPARSVRERLEQHSADAVCAGCHATMDPPGFALENFDPIGRWRETDSGRPVDSSGALPDGTDIGSPAALREAIVARPEIFVGTFTKKLLTYALARGLEPTDMPVVRSIVRDAAREDYRFSALVLGIVQSVPFTMKQAGADASPSVHATAAAPTVRVADSALKGEATR